MKTPACLSSRQAYACPARKRMPSTVATVHQRLKALRSRFLSARRAKSRTRLEARRITVFAQRIGGLTRLIQSSEMPRRTTKALTSAEKTMVVAANSTNRPVKDARRDAPRPSGPSPPPPQPRSIGGGGGPFRTSCVMEPGIASDALRVAVDLRRVRLHDEVPRRAGDAVLVRTVVHHRMRAAEVIDGRRRRNGPFERGRAPGIGARARAPFQAPEEVGEENELHCGGEVRRVRHEHVERDQA